jgi:hypothetical protein
MRASVLAWRQRQTARLPSQNCAPRPIRLHTPRRASGPVWTHTACAACKARASRHLRRALAPPAPHVAASGPRHGCTRRATSLSKLRTRTRPPTLLRHIPPNQAPRSRHRRMKPLRAPHRQTRASSASATDAPGCKRLLPHGCHGPAVRPRTNPGGAATSAVQRPGRVARGAQDARRDQTARSLRRSLSGRPQGRVNRSTAATQRRPLPGLRTALRTRVRAPSSLAAARLSARRRR